MFKITLTQIIIVLCVSNVVAFGVATLKKPFAISPMESSTVLYPIRCFDKYYQLEEMEDKDTCTTELFLRADGVVEFGDTDGPIYTNAVGRWEVPYGTNDYSMTITRTFETGKEGTDAGEFSFDLTKKYSGEMSTVGDSVAITGSMSTSDTANGDEFEVGYFNMIDATDERTGDDKKV